MITYDVTCNNNSVQRSEILFPAPKCHYRPRSSKKLTRQVSIIKKSKTCFMTYFYNFLSINTIGLDLKCRWFSKEFRVHLLFENILFNNYKVKFQNLFRFYMQSFNRILAISVRSSFFQMDSLSIVT